MHSNTFFSVRYFSLVILLILTALSYHPSFAQFVTDEVGVNPLNKYIYLALGITIILHLRLKKIKKNKFAKIYIMFVVLIAVIGFLLQGFNVSDSYISEAKNCLMAFTFLFVGYNANLNRNQVLVLLMSYGGIVLYSTFMQIMVNLGGFTLSTVYLQYGKNILGVMTSSSCIALAYYGMVDDRKFVKVITIAMATILLIFTITIRARASFLSTFLLLGYLSYKKMQTDKMMADRLIKYSFVVIGCILILSLFSDVISSAISYIYESFTLNQGDDLTSGRLNRNKIALDIIANNPFWGNLEIGAQYEWVHNYFLRQFSSYGFIAGFPLLALYLYLVFFVLKNITKCNFVLENIGFMVLLIPIIISLEEPTFPYAPGTGTILSFTLLGYSMCKNDEISSSKC